MVDFSNIKAISAWTISKYAQRNKPIADEWFLEAFGRIEPPILKGNEFKLVASVLAGKRGPKFSTKRSREQIANALPMMERDDVPLQFLEALTQRLNAKRGTKESNIEHKSGSKIDKKRTRSLFKAIYNDFMRLQDGSARVEHPILGWFDVPQDYLAKSDRALMLAHNILCSAGYRLPSIRTLQNSI